ncbi:quinolinate synthase NadA [Gramella jeungdoensis]|uniref:Quinolinate synthase n=1 Tax=Gramella jeungdoensis TaxID=708091 RepID=A0ABT0YY58_9FLAO|nr:quinolinate synthase NadA [Gramella jeungdoensis]MCM8568401.1 quinolinate synthase NadA [Gramella jeungdoensis]
MKLTPSETQKLQDKVQLLKKEKNAVVLAHYYQEPAIKQVADFVGDSLELAKRAAQSQAEIIVFAGVHFMAETAKILNPQRKVLLPDLNAGCSLADSCEPKSFKKFIQQHPEHVVVTYINCSAEIKTMSDFVCTSSNAEKVINSIPMDKEIIFAPDKNLGDYLIQKTGREMLLWDGSCMVHEAFSIDKLLDLHKKYPSARIIAHPESERHILRAASYIGSTSGLIQHIAESDWNTFIVATEAGILYDMQKHFPDKTIIPAPAKENNSCACSECAYMKMNSLEKLYSCLKHETPEIILEQDIMKKAALPINRMLELSN